MPYKHHPVPTTGTSGRSVSENIRAAAGSAQRKAAASPFTADPSTTAIDTERPVPEKAWSAVQQGKVPLTAAEPAAMPLQRFRLPQKPPAGSRQAVVQREIALKDSDNNIYEDQKTGTELGYLYKGYKNYYYFADYEGLTKLIDWYESDEIQQLGLPPDVAIANRVQSYKGYKKEYGAIWYIDENDNLKEEPRIDLVYLQQRLIEVLQRGGPAFWPGGTSNRNPRAKGVLAVKGYPTLEDVLRQLGIKEQDFPKYSGVEMRHLTDEDFERFKQQALHTQANVTVLNDVVYVSTQQLTRSKSAKVRADKKNYRDDFVNDEATLLKLKSSFESLPRPTTEGWVNSFGKVPRGEGQAKAMHNWNALGAAAFANKAYGKRFDLSQNWEWLHIRASQIGGKTKGGNLVAGLYAVNSHMIPYENLVKKWSNEDPGKLQVRFYAENEILWGFAEKIVMDIATNGQHSTLGNIPTSDPLRATFYTFNGKVVDKLASRLENLTLEQHLKTQALGKATISNQQALVPAPRAYLEDASARFQDSFQLPSVTPQISIGNVLNLLAEDPFAPQIQLAFQHLMLQFPPSIQITINTQENEQTLHSVILTGGQTNVPALLPPVQWPVLTAPDDDTQSVADVPLTFAELASQGIDLRVKRGNHLLRGNSTKTISPKKKRRFQILIRQNGKPRKNFLVQVRDRKDKERK